MKRIAIAVVLALLLMLAMPVAVNAASGVTVTSKTGDGTWMDDTWQVSMYPGEIKSTTLNLYNSSSSSLGVEVTIFPKSLDNGNLTFELDKSSFTMPRRSYTDITISVKANGSATPGTYTAELTIKSEVPPRPSRPKPAEVEEPEEEPEVVEPEEEPTPPEEEEPEVIEPEEEPALPEEEEPEVVEPEVVEPEVIEPGEEEEEEVIVPPGTPWGLIGGLAGGLAVAGGLGYWLWLWWKRRRRKEENYGS